VKISKGSTEPPPSPDPPGELPLQVVDIPYGFARDNGLVLKGEVDGRLVIAMREKAPPEALLELRRYLAMPFDIESCDPASFEKLLSAHYAMDGSAAAVAGSMMGDSTAFDLSQGIPTAEDLLDSADDAPTIRLINGILAEAARQGASDVHIEPYETGLVVRMRVDGLLQEKLRMPPHVASVIVNRIKVMARLDIAERRIPQDGRISILLGGKLLDVRVSTLPNRTSERIVMRILDSDSAAVSLDLLGMSDDTHAIIADALAEPNGIILVTGPTGSGKTTTLYAGLKQLNDGSRNILTIEDPVEYAIEGVGQTQVNAKVGLTFAAGLRAILRQDPDVVMIGEIRDRETADIAVQASLTGHLVLATVHTNDAVGAITRLRDMKIEPFLLASTLRAVVAQRLVCQTCHEPVQAEGSMASLLGFDTGTVVYRAVGCDACGHTGYDGRIGVFEAIRVDDALRKFINDEAHESLISGHAFLKRPNLGSAARALVRQGLTTAEEAIRISRREETENG
jgi:general secretion pathway protein E